MAGNKCSQCTNSCAHCNLNSFKEKKLYRINSDSDLHIQHITKAEESVLETLDEIALLHCNKIGDDRDKSLVSKIGSEKVQSGAFNRERGTEKNKFMKQKSLNRTLSTSVLKIKKRRSGFWNLYVCKL